MSKIYYNSTRGGERKIEASYAIVKGIAEDGGLYVPDRIPELKETWRNLRSMSYQEVAYTVMKEYLTDFTEEELRFCIDQAYDEKFDTEAIAPITKAGDAYFLELFHGRTIAFKDMALSILPYLMKVSAKKQNIHNEIVILTATSGDTGKAALEGFADVEGTKIIVFYPKDGVSPIQKQQMVTQKGNNTYVVGIEGNFDDAQNGVKDIFSNGALRKRMNDQGYQFSSANSINIGRLVPQIVYYIYGYAQLLKAGEIEEGESINITVPTGNFGNILAAFYAKNMGLPIKKLLCASNDNKVLYDFLNTGVYDKNREFIVTISPSMDILISSNLERLLYSISGEDGEEIDRLMADLKENGKYVLKEEMKSKLQGFYGNFASEEETSQAIKALYGEDGYVMDPHTAVGYKVYEKYTEAAGDETKTLIASTASPYKFTKSVMQALGKADDRADDFALIEKLHELSKVTIPPAIEEILHAPVLHTKSCKSNQMETTIVEILGLREI